MSDTLKHPFPRDFVWGAATSSFQIEGGLDQGGRGPSIWDTFCATPGKVADGDDGARACEHFFRYRDDVAMMKSLNLQAYRFSVSWPRIQPTGRGPALEAGLDFYERLVDCLLEAGITPWLTLNHWDIPQALQDQGGWTNRETAHAFVEYADIMARRLGDRVKHWITHNEPWVIAWLGFITGEHAPGFKDDWLGMLKTSHHLLWSHGLAVPVIRAASRDSQVGITLNLCPADPASESEADRAATRLFDGEFNRWYLDPVFGKGYPQDVLQSFQQKGRIPAGPQDWIHEGDLDTAAVDCDFLGINYYSRGIIRADIPEEQNAPRTVHPVPEPTEMGWEVHAPSLERLLLRLTRDYGPKALVITENGASYSTPPEGADGDRHVPDVRRQAYFEQHLAACQRAIQRGAPLSGYFAWSLLDNFEWAFGYRQRFGIVWVDYETQERLPKNSARWYAETIRRGGL